MSALENSSKTLEEKLAHLIRRHRQMVFEENGHLHTKAIKRLKMTKTFASMALATQERKRQATAKLYEGMGY